MLRSRFASVPYGLHAQGKQLYLNGKAFRSLGVCFYDAFYACLGISSTSTNWQADLLNIKQTYGLGFVRVAFLPHNSSDMYTYYVQNKTAYYQAVSTFINYCASINLGIVAGIVWNGRAFADLSFYTHGAPEAPVDLAKPTSNCYTDIANYISEFVSFVAYSPAVWVFEVFNEPCSDLGVELWPALVPDGTTLSGTNWGVKSNGTTYVAKDKLNRAGYSALMFRLNNLIRKTDPHCRAICNGSDYGSAFTINSFKHNNSSLDTSVVRAGVAETEFLPWAVWQDRHADFVGNHVYPLSTSDGSIFSDIDMSHYQLVMYLKAQADAANKPYYLEEFNAGYLDHANGGSDLISTNQAQESANFMAFLQAIQDGHILMASAWNYSGDIAATNWKDLVLNTPSRVYLLNAMATLQGQISTV